MGCMYMCMNVYVSVNDVYVHKYMHVCACMCMPTLRYVDQHDDVFFASSCEHLD